MRVKKFFYSVLLVLFASLFVFRPVLALTQQQLDDFANNNILFYDPGDIDTFNCYSSSASTVPETSREAIIWNWFVNANIQGVSNNAEVIAGILGNLKQEVSSFDPFAWGGYHEDGSERARGIFKAHNNNFKNKIEELFGSDIWDKTSELDDETIKRGIEAELEFMVSPEYNWNGSNFPNLLDVPVNKTGEDGAAAYAELFMLVFERPGNYASIEETPAEYRISAFLIQDPGVKNYELIYNSGRKTNHYYLFGRTSDGHPRRSQYAREVYNKYANNYIPTTAQTTVSGADVTIIGDSKLSSIEDSLKTALPGVETRVTDDIISAAALIKNKSVNRQNVFFLFDISKNIIGEENLLDALSGLGSKNLYFVIDKSSENNDNFTVNDALIGSLHDKLSAMYVNNQSEISNSLSSLFAKPVVDICGEATTTTISVSENELFPTNFSGTDIKKMPDDTTNIPCITGNGEIKQYYINGSKKLRLCSVDNISQGQLKAQVSSVALRSFQGFVDDHDTQIYDLFGVHISASQSFRTLEKQIGFWNEYCPGQKYPSSSRSCSNPNSGANEAAYPGTSKHEYGLAIDINVPSKSSRNYEVEKYVCKSTYNVNEKDPYNGFQMYKMKDTPSGSEDKDRGSTAFTKYLCDNLYKYGLRYTVIGEVWHIQYVGAGGHESIK